MFARTVVFIAAVFLSGCTTVNHIPLSQNASGQLQDKLVARTTYPTADFAAFTAGKAAFALMGAAAMIAEGNSIVRENDIQDPAISISQGLVDQLVAARNVRQVPSQTITTGDDIQTLLATYQGANILVDVKTFNWMFNYYPTDWTHYKVTYSARIRLIDYASKKVVAETMCSTVQGDDANPPTKDQLLKDRAALLKRYLNKSAEACIDIVTRDVLLITPTNLETVRNPVQSSGTRSVANSGSGGTKTADGSQSSGQDKPRSSEVQGRQLVGEELRSHFRNLGNVVGTFDSGSGLRLNVKPDGEFWVGHSNPNSMGTIGNFSIRDDIDQICLLVRKLDWKKMELCYELFDRGNGVFRMQSVSNSYYFNYVRN